MNRTISNKWLPILFLVLIWYVPANTAPGGFFEQYIILRWITFIIIPGIILLFLVYKFHFDSKIFAGNIITPLILIFFVIIVSAVIHKSSIMATGFTLSIYLRYPLLFLFFLNSNLNDYSLKLFLKIFFFLVIIQIPECLYRYFILGIYWDNISYTLGRWGTFSLGIYMHYATALMVSKSINVRFKISYLLLILAFFGISVIGEIKSYTIGAPLVSLFIIFSSFGIKISVKKIYFIVFMLIGITVIIIIAFHWFHIVFPDNLFIAAYEDGTINKNSAAIERIAAFSLIFSKTDMKLSNYLFGWGPGSSFLGSYGEKSGIFYSFGIRYKNQLVETFVDIGFVGLFLYYFFLSKLFFRFIKHYKIEFDYTYLYLNRAVMGILLFYGIFGPYYDLIWRHDAPNFIFFFFAAVIYNRYRKLKIIEIMADK